MSPTKVLVADSDALQRQLIDVLFAVDDFEVTLVASGQEALAYLRDNTPGAMVFATDLVDFDGFELCQKVKAVGRLAPVPLVLVTDSGEDGGLDSRTRARARQAGASLLLQRPLGDKNLRERVGRLIQQHPTDPGTTAKDGDEPAPEGASFAASGASGASLGGQAATELGSLRAEVAHLRSENASLKARLVKYRTLAKELQEQLDENRKRPRGLFGRRG